MTSASDIAGALGGKAEGRNHWRCRCPVCNGALIVTDAGRKALVHCFGSGCSQKEVIDTLRSMGLWGSSSGYFYAAPKPSDDPETKRQKAVEVFENAGGTMLCGRYLRSRGITIPVPKCLRLAREVWHKETKERWDAMVGLIERVGDGPIGVHITYLNEDGDGKADISPNKKVWGWVNGGAVRLGEAKAGEWLIVAEGIETTLSAMQMTGHPGWSALNGGNLEKLILPKDVDRVAIAADNDKHGLGKRHADEVADRFMAEGRHVKVLMPKEIGDWNDYLRRPGNEKMA